MPLHDRDYHNEVSDDGDEDDTGFTFEGQGVLDLLAAYDAHVTHGVMVPLDLYAQLHAKGVIAR